MRFSFAASASGHSCIAYANAQETRGAVGGNAAATFVGENLGWGQNENGSAKIRSHSQGRESVRFGKRKLEVPENPVALTPSEADARNVAVADVRFGPSHQQTVDLREQAAEQRFGGGSGNGSGIGHVHSLVSRGGDGRLIALRVVYCIPDARTT